MNSFARFFAAAVITLAGIRPAHADLLAFGYYKGVVGLSASQQRNIPLIDNGGTALTFKTIKANTYVTVTFNATCFVESYSIYGGRGSARVWLTIDGQQPHPQVSFGTTALCSAWSPGSEFSSNSIQVAILVPQAGAHIVRAYGILDYAAYNGALYGLSAMVQN
jgi:hypothetical protein